MGTGVPRGAHPRTPAPPCTASMATPRCTGRRTAAIAESSDRSSMPTPTCTPRTAAGAPFALAANRPLSAPGRVAAAVGRAGTRRCTMPRSMAILHPSRSCCWAALTGPSGPTSTGNAALRRTAETESAAAAHVQAHAEATGGTEWEARSLRGGGEGGALRPPPHSPRHPTLPRAPSVPTLLVPSVRAVGARRSSGEGGNSPRSTRTRTSALAARLFVHYCTRGSKCRGNRARAAAAIGGAKCARARSAVPRTARGDWRAVHANARSNATQ